MKSKLFIMTIVLIFISILFGVTFHYCYSLPQNLEFPFKETLTITLGFIASIVTLLSILFAIFVHFDQEDKKIVIEKRKILSSKPQLMIKIVEISTGNDSNFQKAIILSLQVKNYSHPATSFSLNYEKLPNKISNILIEFDCPYNRDTLNKGDILNIDAYITSALDVNHHPKISDINLYIKAVYLDQHNNSIEDYFLVKPNNSSISISKTKKSNILTSYGKIIEIKEA